MEEEIPLSLMFGKQKSPVKATWFTGVLRCAHGKVLRQSYVGFEALHAKDVYFTVQNGEVVWQQVVDNRREGATRSQPDLKWIAWGRGLVKDEGRWHDARQIGTVAFKRIRESGEPFTTRGIFFNQDEGWPPQLRIPITPTTPEEWIKLHQIPGKHQVPDETHVEIKVHFKKQGKSHRIVVDSMRKLKPGETMHHPDFRPPKKTSESSDHGN